MVAVTMIAAILNFRFLRFAYRRFTMISLPLEDRKHLAAASKRNMFAGTHFTNPLKIES